MTKFLQSLHFRESRRVNEEANTNNILEYVGNVKSYGEKKKLSQVIVLRSAGRVE